MDRNGVEEWCKALEIRFREPTSQSLRRLESCYIQSMVVHEINSGIATTERQQAKLAYNHLNARLRMTITEPTDTISTFYRIRQPEKTRLV